MDTSKEEELIEVIAHIKTNKAGGKYSRWTGKTWRKNFKTKNI